MTKKLNIAMMSYQFMGRAHSNAWRHVNKFFDPPFEPVRRRCDGRIPLVFTPVRSRLR